MTTLKLSASDWAIQGDIALPTYEEAEAFIALLPKACKLHTCGVSDSHHTGLLRVDVTFRANLPHGEINAHMGTGNETGLKRYRALRRACTKLGVVVEWEIPGPSFFKTEAEFEAHLEKKS